MSNPFRKVDPNVQAKQEFVLRQFAAQVANGHAYAIDRINQRIEVGSLVVWRPPADLIFEVVDIAPVLNPGEPPGRLKLALSTLVPDHIVSANVRQLSMIVIGKQIAPGHADISGPKMQSEPDSPDHSKPSACEQHSGPMSPDDVEQLEPGEHDPRD